MKFLHISDTHYLINNSADIYGINYNPNDILEFFLKEHDFSVYDFIVHTGDLISDGNQSDYEALFELEKKYVPSNIPVYHTLGNHDNREDFFKAKQINMLSKEYYYKIDYHGYRLIFLDTLNEGYHSGVLGQKQLEWLYEILNFPSKNGTLIFMHHPIELGWYSNHTEFNLDKYFIDNLVSSDAIAIFTGHIHMQRTSLIQGIPQYTANSLAFGISLREDKYWRNNRLGYSYVVINNHNIDYNHEILYPSITDFKLEKRQIFNSN